MQILGIVIRLNDIQNFANFIFILVLENSGLNERKDQIVHSIKQIGFDLNI